MNDIEMRLRLTSPPEANTIEVREDPDGLGLVEIRDTETEEAVVLTVERAPSLIAALQMLLAHMEAKTYPTPNAHQRALKEPE